MNDVMIIHNMDQLVQAQNLAKHVIHHKSCDVMHDFLMFCVSLCSWQSEADDTLVITRQVL